MNILKVKHYSAYEISRIGLTFKLKCFKKLPTGEKIELAKPDIVTFNQIINDLPNDLENCGCVNLPDEYDGPDDVISHVAPDGFYFDQILASFVSANDLSIIHNHILIEKTRFFVAPGDSHLYDIKTDIYLIDPSE